MINFSVVIPVYNGEKTVCGLFEQIKTFFEKQNLLFEVIFVNDNGPDNSWAVLKKLKKTYPNLIKLIKLSRNFGQHNAIICGFEFVEGEFVITMDEDLQHSPQDIGKLIAKQKEGDFDLVYGKYEEFKHSYYRNVSSKLLKKFIKKGITELHNDYSAFRLIKTSIAKSTIEMRNSYTFLDGYLAWITSNVSSCFVAHNKRQGGVSSYTFSKLVNHSINVFVTFSNLPIRMLTTFSVFILIGMTFFSIYIISRKVIYNDFALGYPSMILAIGFGIGIVMFALGIIGEYIYRINLKTTKRPNYHINKIL